MLSSLDSLARNALLDFYAVDAEATEAAHRVPADAFDERAARLMGRAGVLGEGLWSMLPRDHPAARDAMFTVGEVGMALAGPSLGMLYWRLARRFLRFAIDHESDVFDEATRDRLAQFALGCLYYEKEPGVDLDVETHLDFPAQCLSIRDDESNPDDPLLIFEYRVAGPISEPDQALAFAHHALQDNYGLAVGKLFASDYLIFQIALPREAFTPSLLASTCRLTIDLGLSARNRLRSDQDAK